MASAPSPHDADSGSLAEDVYRRVRRLIVTGQLAPGSRLAEAELATRLEISRTPVRLAVRQLERDGYVVVDDSGPRRRATVAPLTREDAGELFSLIGAIEGVAAAGAAALPDSARRPMVARMRAANEAFRACGEDGPRDVELVFRMDRAFHHCFVREVGGSRLQALHDALNPHSDRYIRFYLASMVDDLHTSAAEHDGIIAAIEAGDADGAQRAAQRNWQRVAGSLQRVIGSMGERGTWG